MKHICFLLLFLLPTSSHVVFEEIGTMAGSTSYIHITVKVGLQDIEDKVMEYTTTISGYKAQINRTFDAAADSWKRATPHTPFDDHRDKYLDMVKVFTHDAGKLKSRIVLLQGVLPTPSRDVRAEREERSLFSMLLNVGKKVAGSTVAGGSGTNIIKVA